MSRVVLDASAVLATLYQEAGSERVVELLSEEATEPMISAVNLSEVYARLLRDELSEDEAFQLLQGLKLTVVPFAEADAYRTGRFNSRVAKAGLSFGDRACLALAEEKEATAWTADRAWSKVKTGVAIELIRHRASPATDDKVL